MSVTATPQGFLHGQTLVPTATTAGSIGGAKTAYLGSANVVFGPYSLSLKNAGVSPLYFGSVSHTFTVTVYGSTPGQVAGSSPLTMVQLGSVSKKLTAALGQTVTGSISVPVVMPGVFTDIMVVAKFSPGPGGRPDAYQFPSSFTYPSANCGKVTPGLLSSTDACMQGAINPTGVLVPDVMPLSIVYEPPGNCSWSNLTFSSEVGSTMAMTQANSTATNNLWSYSAAGGLYSGASNTTQTVNNANSATATFNSTTTQAFGTSFGLPTQDPGNPFCNAGMQVGDTSATNGPGVGDEMVFVVQPTFLYWDTAGLTTYRLSTQQAPGTQETLGTAFVRQIDPARPSLRPSFMANMTTAQLQAIRGLDAFAPVHTGAAPVPQTTQPMACSSGASLSPSRFIYLGRRCTAAGSSLEVTQGTAFDSTTTSELTSGYQTIKSTNNDPAAKNASVVVGAIAGVAGATVGSFDTYGKASMAFDQFVLHNTSTTTVTQNISTNASLMNAQASTFAETFLERDQNQEVDMDLYYDTFFGTIAFNPVTSCHAPQTGNSCYATAFGNPIQAWRGSFAGAYGTFVGDVDKDGKKDLIAVNAGNVNVIRSTGTSFGGNEVWLNGAFFGSHGTLVADVDGDGRADLINLNDGSVTVKRSTGAAFGATETWWTSPFYGSHGTFAADVDGDGAADLVAVGDGYVGVIRSQGVGFGAYETWLTYSFFGSHGTYLADVDGDGQADLVALGDGYVAVVHSNGTSFVNYENWMPSSFYGTQGTLVADVTGDGRADLVAVNDTNVLVSASTGTAFGAASTWAVGSFAGAAGSLIGDVTGDRRADVVSLGTAFVSELDSVAP
jgi:hypothetical protein